MTFAEIEEYLSFIRRVTDTTTDGCGGFILNISENGDLNLVPFDNVAFLAKALDFAPEPPDKIYTTI